MGDPHCIWNACVCLSHLSLMDRKEVMTENYWRIWRYSFSLSRTIYARNGRGKILITDCRLLGFSFIFTTISVVSIVVLTLEKVIMSPTKLGSLTKVIQPGMTELSFESVFPRSQGSCLFYLKNTVSYFADYWNMCLYIFPKNAHWEIQRSGNKLLFISGIFLKTIWDILLWNAI